MNGRTALYRLYGGNDDLLYVGVTYSISTRWEQHAKKQSWWPQVTRQTIAWFDDRSVAEENETAAIETEHPTYNIRGVKGRAKDEVTGFPASRRSGSGFKSITSEEARCNFRRLLSDTERGVHTEITRYGDGVAAVVPCEWMDQVILLLAGLRQADAAWDLHVPIDTLREVAKTAAGLLAPAVDDEHAAYVEEVTRLYVEDLKQKLQDEPEPAGIVPVTHDDQDQGT